MPRWTILIAAVAVLTAVAEPAAPQPAAPSTPLPASAYGVPWQQVNDSDRRYIRTALLSLYVLTDLARLAAQNGSIPALRQGGAALMRESQSLAAALRALAERKGVKAPRHLDPAQIAPLDRIAALRGAAFDRAYLAALAQNRAAERRAGAAELYAGSDPDVRAFARQRQAQTAAGGYAAGTAPGLSARPSGRRRR